MALWCHGSTGNCCFSILGSNSTSVCKVAVVMLLDNDTLCKSSFHLFVGQSSPIQPCVKIEIMAHNFL